MLAIIDADIPAFVETLQGEAHANPFGGDFGPNVQRIAQLAGETMVQWTQEAGADSMVLAFSCPNGRNFRKWLMPGKYKAHRSEKPAGYSEVVELLKQKFASVTIDGLEGDDVCGILHGNRGDTVTISTDKDFKTLPGLHYNPSKMTKPELITPCDAWWFWMYQTLVGDSADGYKGARGIGDKKARQLLRRPTRRDHEDPATYARDLWQTVLQAFLGAHGADVGLEVAVSQARAARILQRQDYDPKVGIRLWHPEKVSWLQLNPDFRIY